MSRPVFLLAYSYDPTAALPELAAELKALEGIVGDSDFALEIISRATQQDIEEKFLKYKDDLRIFHYCGHAGPSILQLNQDGQSTRVTFSAGLAGFAGMATGLRLVFLNGCSTDDQAEAFHRHGIPAVIATSKPVKDRLAVDFAKRFYQTFTNRHANLPLQQAFQACFYSFLGANGPVTEDMIAEPARGGFVLGKEASDAPLYDLRLQADKAAVVGQEKCADWYQPIAPPPPTTPVQPQTPTPQGVDIRQLIAEDRLEEALQALASKRPDEGILLLARFRSVKRQHGLGTITFEDFGREQARIRSAALELA